MSRSDPALLIGLRFGRLTIVSTHVPAGSERRATYRCDCGAVGETWVKAMKQGYARSCGCLRSEVSAASERTHGLTYLPDGRRRPEHTVWTSMIGRCENPRNSRYADWGGRGIRLCRRWRESFKAFYDDMGPRPSPEHSIDRINNDGDYEPGNCRWATRAEQRSNRRKTRPYHRRQRINRHVA